MMRLVSLALIIAALAFLLSPRLRRRARARAPMFILGAVALTAIGLAITGRLNWIFAAISAALPAIWRFAPLLRFLPVIARLTGRGRDAGASPRGDDPAAGNAPPPRRDGRMSRQEAADMLGVETDADRDSIMAAHRRLIQRLHPDRGGTDYLASRLNEARDVLLEVQR
ncbi:molecular chaperone DnaJ [Gammaproteobacteria bacterium 2W06]|nr:molecular chaperone DnaJ [Gammaproteobacteria bacterium 2W06]